MKRSGASSVRSAVVVRKLANCHHMLFQRPSEGENQWWLRALAVIKARLIKVSREVAVAAEMYSVGAKGAVVVSAAWRARRRVSGRLWGENIMCDRQGVVMSVDAALQRVTKTRKEKGLRTRRGMVEEYDVLADQMRDILP